MTIEYRFVLDKSYLRQSVQRSISQWPVFLRPSVQAPTMIVAAAAGWIGLSYVGLPSIGVVLVGLAAIAVLGSVVTPMLLSSGMLRHLKKSQEFGREVSATLSEIGFSSVAHLSEGKIEWAAIRSAVRHADGIMLQHGQMRVWLPDAGLKNSTSDEATTFVSAKIELVPK